MPAWLSAFEQSQAIITQVLLDMADVEQPGVDLRPAAEQLKAALGAVFDAFDLRGDRLSQIREALGALGRSEQALAHFAPQQVLPEAAPQLVSVRELLMAAEKHFAGKPGALASPARAFRASTELLSLHRVERASLLPCIRYPEPAPPLPLELPPLERPKTVADLKDTVAKMKERQEQRRAARDAAQGKGAAASEPTPELTTAPLPEGFIGDIEPVLSDTQFAQRRARDMFEEVAMVGAQRIPQLGDSWRSIRFLEKRMYAAVDAVAALGEAGVMAVEELVVDSPAKDPTRGFAAIVLLGSLEGRDALAAAERVVQYLGAQDAEVAAYASQAMKLVPHPHLALALRRMLSSSLPQERAMALDVLAHRGLVSLEELARYAADEAPEVASVALVALGLNAPYHNQLGQLLMAAAARPGVQPASWLGMALSGHPNAKYAPAKALDGPDADQAALALALVADNHVAESLTQRCRNHASTGLVTAVGWAGAAAEALPILIELLGHEDEEMVAAVAYALDRITGAQLYEEVEVDPEQIIVPEVPVPEVEALESDEPPLARQISDPRDIPAEGSPDTIERPTTNPEAWADYYRERRGHYQPGARYRRGHAYAPKVSLWELDGWRLNADERRYLQYELVVRTGHLVRFDPLDVVAVQQQALKDWEEIIEGMNTTAGAWSRPSRRR